MALWTAVVLASSSWLFAFRLIVSPEPRIQWALVGGAWMAAAAGFSAAGAGLRLPAASAWLLAPLSAVLAWGEPAFRPGAWVAAAGLAASILSARRREEAGGRLAALGLSGIWLGAILAAQGPLCDLYAAWTARNPDVPLAAPLLAPILRWVGADASASDGILHLRMMRASHPFALGWTHLAGLPLLLIAAGGSLALLWDGSRRPLARRWAALLALSAGYGIVRLALVALAFVTAMLLVPYESDATRFGLFWLPSVTALSFLPLIPFLARLLPLGSPREAGGGGPARSAAGAIACAALAACAAVFALHFHDPGTRKGGRVLIDASRSRWERIDRPYDTDWYGTESGYNYWCAARYLDRFFPVDVHREGPLTAERLSGCDVLLLKTPTAPYAPEEVDAIARFVEAGGGLFLIGEHTNVFGSSVFLNPVLRRFGMALRSDCVFDIERRWEECVFPPSLGRHPAILDVPHFLFAVSCSIQADGASVRPVLRPGGLWTLPIHYPAENFYPPVVDRADARWGAFDQMAAVERGAGRVAAFGDSTVFSNFSAFQPGKPELLLGTVEWLNRRNRWAWLNGAAWILCAALAGAGLLLGRPWPCASALLAAAGAGWAALALLSASTRAAYPAPAPRTEPVRIAFDLEHGACELPLFGFIQDHARSYEVFFQWVQRLGYFPRADLSLEAALSGSRAVVVANPRKDLSPAEEIALRGYVERGGALLVLSSADPETAAAADRLVRPFGLSFLPGPLAGALLAEPSSGAPLCPASGACVVAGGEPLLGTDAGETVAAFARAGKGIVVAAGLGEIFTDPRMGGSHRAIPDRPLRALYEVEFSLLRGMVEGDLPGRIRKLGEIYR